tara:strand:- start:1179 stop:2150 length:972 start_codon:yes stop_codon:yes gene_type:complete
MEFNEIIRKINGSSNMKTPNKFVASNSGGDMNDKLNRVNQHSSPVNLMANKGLANKGRNGDNMIRTVDGQPSHVNAYEAYMIDNWGKAGEAKTKQIGSGTINPKTGLKEYNFLEDIGDWFEDNITTPIREEILDPVKEGLQEYVYDPIKAIFPTGDTGWFSESRSDNLMAYDTNLENYENAMGQFGTIAEVEAMQNKQERDARKLKLDQYYRDEFTKLSDLDTGGFSETGSIAQKQRMLQAKLNENRNLAVDDFNRTENLTFDNWLAMKQGQLQGIIGDFTQAIQKEDTEWQGNYMTTSDADYSAMDDATYIFEGTDYEYTGG